MKPPELKVAFKDNDTVFSFDGDQDHKDATFLKYAFSRTTNATDKMSGVTIWGPSLLQELLARGYDISTLRLSVKKKQK